MGLVEEGLRGGDQALARAQTVTSRAERPVDIRLAAGDSRPDVLEATVLRLHVWLMPRAWLEAKRA
jgi:hypothetical protein